MSGEVISMEEWERAKFVDWAVRFAVPLLLQLDKKSRARALARLQRHVNEQRTGDQKP